jgi:hypothetical protein
MTDESTKLRDELREKAFDLDRRARAFYNNTCSKTKKLSEDLYAVKVEMDTEHDPKKLKALGRKQTRMFKALNKAAVEELVIVQTQTRQVQQLQAEVDALAGVVAAAFASGQLKIKPQQSETPK